MFLFFFKNCYHYYFLILYEVLKYFKIIISIFKNKRSNGFFFNFIIFNITLWPDENTYYLFSSFFDFLFFSYLFNVNIFFFFFQYTYFFFLINLKFFPAILFIYFLFGLFLFFFLFFLFFFFFSFAFILNLIEILFKTKIAGLVMFSKDFLSIEDEDLWVSSTIFYFDNKVLEVKDFKTSLSSQEIEVFHTIIRLFFDVPSNNSEYLFFSNELLIYRNDLKNYLTNGKIKPDDAQKFLLNLRGKPFEKFPAYSSSIKSFNKINNSSSVNLFSKYSKFFLFSNFYSRSFFGIFFHISNFVFPSQKRRKLKDRVQKYEKSIYLKKRSKSFHKYMRGYYFSKYGLIYKNKNNKSSKFALINPNKKEIPIYIKNQIKNENIYWQNKKSIFNYYNSFKDDFNYLSSSINFPKNTFELFRKPTLYNTMNNKIKLQRFRKFFWFSFPFYIIEVTWNLRSFFYFGKILHFFFYVYKMFLSKIFYSLFSLFGDPFLNGNSFLSFFYYNYDPYLKVNKNERNFFRFLTINSKNKTSTVINDGLYQFYLDLSQTFEEVFYNKSSNTVEDKTSTEQKFKPSSETQDKKLKNLQSNSKLKNENSEKPISIRKKRRYRRYLKRKKGTLKKISLINSNKYSFSNKFNSQSFFSQPNIELLDFYKLLEYFYFILTNNIDFYENAQFLAKVELLRQKYGQPIVNDLLNREDHKQAAKVSVQMHFVDHDIQSITDSQIIENKADFVLNKTESDEVQKNLIKDSFEINQSKSVFYKKSNNLINDLVLSYKYRFKK